eukprot:scaffold1810_cov321-Pavlova_lutheri.AAC.1
MELQLADQAASMELGEEQTLQNKFPGQVVSLRAARSGPRMEFLTTEAFLGTFDAKVCTKAYIDTLASFSFLSEKIFKQLQHRDPAKKTWFYTSEYFDFECAVGEKIHQAQVISARIQVDSFHAWVPFGITHLNSFDCILGYDFCAEYLVGIPDFAKRQLHLRDRQGLTHVVIGDGDFISRRKLDLIVPPSEVQQALHTPGCLFLMIQPLDTSAELQAEAEDFELKRSKLTAQYPLTPDQQQRLSNLKEKYSVCFEPRTTVPVERVPGESFKIEVETGTVPFYRNYYRMSPQQLEILRDMLAEYVDSGKMDLCAGSSWGAPVILVPKKDKGWRIVFDYRRLNSVTIKDRYPLPRIDDYLEQLTGAAFFSAFDALDGFHQLPMDADSIAKTAVNTPMGSYVWKVMPMGLANAPAAFQRMMNRIFGHLLYAKVYMDDILVHSASVEAHFQHLEEFLSVCAENDIKLKASKCHFFYTKLEWIGFNISERQITPTDTLLNKIARFPKPTTQKQNLAFLGLCNFYRRFIDRYWELSAPLVELNKKTYKQDFADYWGGACDQAYEQLRTALTSRPVLALYDPDLPTRVETDASDIGMGAVLTQCHGEDTGDPTSWKPVEYYSKRWNTSQKNYHPAEKETCAIIYALQHWQHLLFGQKFTILTDNKVAHYLQTKGTEQLSQRDIRWMEKLQFFAPFEIQYRPGAENIAADYLSRHPPKAETNTIPTYCILDLCAGMGTVLRALELVCNDRQCQIDYVAVEQDPFCRLVIQRVFNFVRLAVPGLFVRTDIFRLGHDVKTLAGRRKLPSVNLVIAGVPCQPFSRANTTKEAAPLGLLDTRELFSSVRLLLDRLPSTHYVIECTPFADHLI